MTRHPPSSTLSPYPTLSRSVVDAEGEFARGEPAEDDRVDRADPRTGQHRDHGLGNHRHIDDHPVAAPDAEPHEHSGEGCHLVPDRKSTRLNSSHSQISYAVF